MKKYLISSKDVIERDGNNYRIFSSHETRQAAIDRAKELNAAARPRHGRRAEQQERMSRG